MDSNIITDKNKLRWIIISVCFAGFISTLDDYIVNISLPTISHDFNASTSEVAQVTLSYLLFLTGSLLLAGKLGDRFGYKRIFISGYFVFTISSLLCFMSPGLKVLVIFRSIQGIGAAMLSVMSPAIIGRFVPPDMKGWAFGILTTACALGITLGAPLGGLITTFVTWHWIFFINVPLGLIAIFFTHRAIPKEIFEVKNKKKLPDVPGMVLSFAGIFCLTYGLNMGEELGGWTSTPVICLFIVSLISIVAFIFWEKELSRPPLIEHDNSKKLKKMLPLNADPLVDLNIFRNLEFSFANLSTLLSYMLLAGCNFLLPFYLILVKGLKPHETGIIMLIYSLVYAFISPFMGRMADKIHPRSLCVTGMISAMGACLFFAFTLKYESLILVIIYLVWRAISYGMFISPNNKLVMSLVPSDKQGAGSSILKVATNLSLLLGICLFETVFSLPVPEGMFSLDKLMEHSKNIIFAGFHDAYLFGAVICLLAAMFSLYQSIRKKL